MNMIPNQIRDAINKADVVKLNGLGIDNVQMADFDMDSAGHRNVVATVKLKETDNQGHQFEICFNVLSFYNATVKQNRITMRDENGDLYDIELYMLCPIMLGDFSLSKN